MASYNDYVKQFQAYSQAAQAKDPAWQAWQQDAARYTPDMGVAPEWKGTDWFGEWFGSMQPAQQQEYLQRLNESRAADAKSITGRLGQIAKVIPAAVGGIGLAGAAGLLNGTALGSAAGFGGAAPAAAAAAPSAAAIEAAVGIPELGLAAQTGGGGGLLSSLGPVGSALGAAGSWMAQNPGLVSLIGGGLAAAGGGSKPPQSSGSANFTPSPGMPVSGLQQLGGSMSPGLLSPVANRGYANSGLARFGATGGIFTPGQNKPFTWGRQ